MKISLNYTILITSCPFDNITCIIALNFCYALLKRNHKIECIFFLANASQVANSLIACPSDEVNINQQWQQFISDNKIPGKLCISSSLRRGIINETYAEQFAKYSTNLASGFEITGLTDLFVALQKSDRFIQFG